MVDILKTLSIILFVRKSLILMFPQLHPQLIAVVTLEHVLNQSTFNIHVDHLQCPSNNAAENVAVLQLAVLVRKLNKLSEWIVCEHLLVKI